MLMATHRIISYLNPNGTIGLRIRTASTVQGNTAFINFFCGSGESSAAVLETFLKTVFDMMPLLENICYFAPDSVVMFPPFNSTRPSQKTIEKGVRSGTGTESRLKRSKLDPNFFKEVALLPNCVYQFSLQLCQRSDFYPVFEVRRALVEDCDDLIPILKRNRILQPNQGDHYIAELLETESESTRSLVAEIDGQVVGFMVVDQTTNQSRLRDSYDLEAYDLLTKSPIRKSEPEMPAPSAADLSVRNTFHISLFCMDPQYGAMSLRFLQFAFAQWPTLEYCVLTMPKSAPESPILRYFSPIKSKLFSNDHLLYITNRYTLKGDVDVVKTTEIHIPAILKLVDNMSRVVDFVKCVIGEFPEKSTRAVPETVQDQKLAGTSAKPNFISFSALSDNQVIGCVVLELCDPTRTRALLDQYDIENFYDTKWSPIENSYCAIKYLIMNPLFESQTRYFCRDVMRQLKANCLLYPRAYDDREIATKKILLREFVPVMPRRMIEFTNNIRDGEPLPADIEGNLLIITMPLILEPRMVIHTPIVVMGGSEAGISFLETLIYTPHLQFTNLILISKSGIPTSHEKDHPFVDSQDYSSLRLKQLSIDYFIDIIQETVKLIHRHEKTITLSNGQTIPFEYLLLTPGIQYLAQTLDPALIDVQGVYGMNTTEFASIKDHLSVLRRSAKDGKIVIYGKSLQAYMTAEYCLKVGLNPSRIVLVDPSLENLLFSERLQIDIISQTLRTVEGLQFLDGHNFVEHTEVDGRISGLTLKNRNGLEVHINNVDVLLYADVKKIDSDSFKCINDANLVFDSSIVIDNVFRTVDPYVFAAGTATKYSVDLKTSWRQSFCSSKEVGERVAWFLLHLFDPNLTFAPTILATAHDDYGSAVKVYSYLPGGLKYYHYDIPKLPTYVPDPNRRDLVIHRPGLEYSRITVDAKGFIHSFTYLGPRDIEFSNLCCLYGRHEKYFNRLVSRFDEGVIPDFIAYFQETWALCMFHDRFPLFISQMLEGAMQSDGDIKDIVGLLDANAGTFTMKEEDELYVKFDSSASKSRDEMNKSVFGYLTATQVFKSYP